MNPQAILAAAEVAGAQGRSSEMHDRLREHQTALTEVDVLGYARAVGVEKEKFTSEQSERDPPFYSTGFRHHGSYELEELLEAVGCPYSSGVGGRPHGETSPPRARKCSRE